MVTKVMPVLGPFRISSQHNYFPQLFACVIASSLNIAGLGPFPPPTFIPLHGTITLHLNEAPSLLNVASKGFQR